MTSIDRFLRDWRIRVASRWIPANARILDVGCFDGRLFERLGPSIREGVGIDPLLKESRTGSNWRLFRGAIPGRHDVKGPFDCITALAVVEHLPAAELSDFASECAALLNAGGLLILTVPDPLVDRILAVLTALRLVHGMSLEEHHGFDASRTAEYFERSSDLALLSHSRFQLGLNNLFVFSKPAPEESFVA